MLYPAATLKVCTDCAMIIANDDATGLDYHLEPDAAAARLSAILKGIDATIARHDGCSIHIDATDAGEFMFRCSVCGAGDCFQRARTATVLRAADTGSIDVDAFVDGYLAAAVWADTIESDIGEPYTDGAADDLTPGTAGRLRCQALEILGSNADLYRHVQVDHWTHSHNLGINTRLSASGHGSGLWDADLGELGDELHDRVRHSGESTLEADILGEISDGID